jgi:hypothetical protein
VRQMAYGERDSDSGKWGQLTDQWRIGSAPNKGGTQVDNGHRRKETWKCGKSML